MGRRYVGRTGLPQGVVVHVGAHVGQDRLLGPDPVYPAKRLFQMGVGRVRRHLLAVNDPGMDACQRSKRCISPDR